MTRRSRRLLKIVGVVYFASLCAFLWVRGQGRALVTRPELIPERLTIVQRGMFTGWRAEERFADAKAAVVAARYRMRAAHAGLEAGHLVDAPALDKLVAADPGTVLVWNPRLCRAFAALRAVSGEEIADSTGNVLARVGDTLDEDRLIDMAVALDPLEGERRRTRISIRGTGRVYYLDITSAFVCANGLVLAVMLYALLWEPVLRLLNERALAIRGEVETATQQGEPPGRTSGGPG
jgi:hypothetical protein